MSPAVARFLRDGFAFWSVLALVALFNGVLCAPLLLSLFGQPAAQAVSSLTYLLLAYPLILLFFVLVERPAGAAPYWVLGALWAILTLAFEGILFVGVLEFPLAGVTEAFTLPGLLAGNLLALELILLLIAPALLSRLVRREVPARRRPRRRQERKRGLPVSPMTRFASR